MSDSTMKPNAGTNDTKPPSKPRRTSLLNRGSLPTPSAPTTFADMTASPQKKANSPEMKKSSVTVRGSTRIMLNALIVMDKADTLDDLVTNIVGDYIDSELTDAERQEYDMIVQRLRGKLNK